MAAEDGPPPLEDMTATLEQAKKLRNLRLGPQDSSTSACSNTGPKTDQSAPKQPSPASAVPAPHSQTQTSTAPTSHTPKNAQSAPSKKLGSGDFGGMRKGFLFGGSKPSGAVSGKQQTTFGSKAADSGGKGEGHSQAESIPFVQARPEDKNASLKLDGVQKAMESTKGFLQDKEWVTDDLLEKVQKNETLSKRLGDPRFMQAVTEFQADPKAAMMKYQDSPEMQQFLKEFCGILGDHFSSMGKKEDGETQAQRPANTTSTGPRITELTDKDRSPSQGSDVPVDPHVQQILADPANREILMDPKVQQLIEHLRSDPEKAQRLLRGGDSDFRHKVDRLISLGLLKFQG
ncbi:hypothetical protein ACOMHN_037176 [Nucella lapillus]